MDESDFFLIFIFGGATLAFWAPWYLSVLTITHLAAQLRYRFLLGICPPLCLLMLFLMLRLAAAHDVRQDSGYLVSYTLLGAAWLGAAARLFPFLGVSPRDDVLERANDSAAWAVCGGLIGVTLCFAGGNVGDGPGMEAVVFSALLATLGFFLLWLLLESFSKIPLSEQITVERNTGAGVRLGGFLVAIGILLGWGVAGGWTSVSATLGDFIPWFGAALLLTTLSWAFETLLRPRLWKDGSPAIPSALIAIAYLGFALLCVAAEQ